MPLTTPDAIGRYQVLRHLGGGGMGTLYLAQDPAIDRLVAIKVLKEGADNPEMRRRFTKEARAAGRLRHHHIVAIFDVGEHEGKPFIAMEYVQGETLENLILRRVPMSLERKLELMDALFAGLQYAHRNGIVHRDIKPANLMIDDDGVLKILDFGIARHGKSDTQHGQVVGSLNYMSPEQLLSSQTLDARADMFSSGAVFYEILSGRQAFPGELPGVLTLILQRQPEPLDQIVPGLAREITGLVSRCLEKDPNDRPADMAALRRELAEIRRRHGSDVTGDPPPEQTGPRLPAGTTPHPRGSRRDTSRQELLRIRAEQIDAHLAEANAALERGAFQEALDACHRALMIDPENDRVLAVEESAQAGIETLQLAAWLAEARGELDRGSLTAASVLVERALSLNSSSPDAIALRAAVDEARRLHAESQVRSREVEAALARGRKALAAGDLQAAQAAVADALSHGEANSDAVALKRDIERAIETKREAEAAARAREQVADARRRFAAGDHESAIAVLERADAHPLVAAALAELRIERQEIERVRRELALKLEEATLRFGRRDLQAALALVDEVLEREASREDARALRKKISEAIAEQKRISAAMSEAQTLVGTGRFKAALDTLEVVARAEPGAVGLPELRKAAEAGLAAEAEAQKRKQFETCLAAAERAVHSGTWPVALEQIQLALRLEPEDRKARELKATIEAGMAAAIAGGKKPGESGLGGKTVLIPATPEPPPARKPPPPAPPTVVQKPAAAGGQTIVIQPPADPGNAPLHRPGEQRSRGGTIVMGPGGGTAPAPAPPMPVPGPNRLYAIGGGAALLVIALIAWLVWPSPDTTTSIDTREPIVQPTGPGPSAPLATVAITIAPWARIESITTRDGQPAPGAATGETPLLVTLPAGTYRVKAVNPNYQRPLEFDLTVEPGVSRDVFQTMPDFRVDEEIESVLKR